MGKDIWKTFPQVKATLQHLWRKSIKFAFAVKIPLGFIMIMSMSYLSGTMACETHHRSQYYMNDQNKMNDRIYPALARPFTMIESQVGATFICTASSGPSAHVSYECLNAEQLHFEEFKQENKIRIDDDDEMLQHDPGIHKTLHTDSEWEAYTEVSETIKNNLSVGEFQKAAIKLCKIIGKGYPKETTFRAIEAVINSHLFAEKFAKDSETQEFFGVSSSCFKTWKRTLKDCRQSMETAQKVTKRTVFPWRHQPEVILPTAHTRVQRNAATKASERIMESVHLTKGPSQKGFSNTAQTAEGKE